MSDTRTRLADALVDRLADYGISGQQMAKELAETVLSVTGIAVVELPDREISESLLWLLRRAGDEWGPREVLQAAALVAVSEPGRERAIRELAGELRAVHDRALGDPWKELAVYLMADKASRFGRRAADAGAAAGSSFRDRIHAGGGQQ